MNRSQKVLITGASSGFGAYLAHAFANAGYDVILHGRNEAKLASLKEEIIKSQKSNISYVIGDMRVKEENECLQEIFKKENVGILINNAAINPELEQGMAESSYDGINDVFLTNTASTIALCYAAFEHFKVLGGGMIMNINSVAGLRGSSHEPLYAASKFGLRGFSESVKEDWLREGVKMTDVYPGAIGAGMSAKRADIADLIDPKEFAAYLVALCSTKSFFINELSARRINIKK